jgi:hypothetical protein
MAGLKVTLDAALRARDVSRPTAAQEAEAERALPDRLAVRRPSPPESGQPPAVGGAAIRPFSRAEAADHAAESPESLTAGQQARRGPRHRPPRPGDGRLGERRPRDRRADIPETDDGRTGGGRASGSRADGDEPRPAPGADADADADARGTAKDAARDPGQAADAPGAPDREAGEPVNPPRGSRPRMRRRYRLGRLADSSNQNRPADYGTGGLPADHGSGGSSPDCS